LLWDVIFLAIVYFGIDQYGIHIASYATIITHLIYLIVIVFISRRYLLIKLPLRVVWWLLPMFIIIISVLLATKENSIYTYVVAMVASLLMAYHLIHKKDFFLG